MFTELWRGLKSEKRPNPEQLLIDYKEVFGTEAGNRVLHDIERKTTFSHSSVSGFGQVNVERLIYDEGQRAMFLYIIKKIHSIPKEKERKVKNAESD